MHDYLDVVEKHIWQMEFFCEEEKDGSLSPLQPGDESIARGSWAKAGRLYLFGDPGCLPAGNRSAHQSF